MIAEPSRAEAAHRAHRVDAVVVGAGFGGLAAALTLAERGADVVLLEKLDYPGGCASTFRRGGYRFEAGATLFSGFAPGQLFARWIEAHGLPVQVDRLDPMVTLRTPDLTFDVPPDRDTFVARFCALSGAPVERLRAFFEHQRRVADVLWEVLDDPSLLPPFGASGLVRHAGRVARYAPLLGVVGRPAIEVLRAHGLAEWSPLRTFLDALCQITVQCGVDESEAPFALSTMDYYFRGTGHVRGGIGSLASALAGAITRRGGDVRFTSGAKRLERRRDGWRVHTRHGPIDTKTVVANLLPRAVERLLDPHEAIEARALAPLHAALDDGWGAAMLYLVVEPAPRLASSPHHLELVVDPSQPFVEGNHLFCSLSGPADEGRAPPGLRTLTVSTHVPIAKYRALAPDAQAEYVRSIQARMHDGLTRLAPDLVARVAASMTASPRTFERFTARPDGLVGGIPRRAGLHNYRRLLPVEPRPGLFLTGDTVFPGQSTLATALGGVKVAERIAGRLGARAGSA
ncbi:NAD(P)/FAD-dependent oxidoreductase [Myxococcota bacterium]|nr:NAD(P)/FAD-dependent oxidoreductase [Myxococcota bacterium]